MSRLLIFLLVIASLSSAAKQVNFELETFNKLEVFGKLNVRLEKADYDSLVIQSSQYDVGEVKYEVNDGKLSVKLLSEFPPSIKVNVTVFYSDSLIHIFAGGGAKLYNKGVIESSELAIKSSTGSEFDLLIKVDSLNVKVNKGAFLRLTGESNVLVLKTASGGAFRSTKMINNKTYAVLAGGTAEIKTAKYLNVKAMFGASLKFVEKPNKIVKKERLGGQVGKLEEF